MGSKRGADFRRLFGEKWRPLRYLDEVVRGFPGDLVGF